MSAEQMAFRSTASEHRNQKIFEMTKVALEGLLASERCRTDEELADVARRAVKAARLTIRELLIERVI